MAMSESPLHHPIAVVPLRSEILGGMLCVLKHSHGGLLGVFVQVDGHGGRGHHLITVIELEAGGVSVGPANQCLFLIAQVVPAFDLHNLPHGRRAGGVVQPQHVSASLIFGVHGLSGLDAQGHAPVIHAVDGGACQDRILQGLVSAVGRRNDAVQIRMGGLGQSLLQFAVEIILNEILLDLVEVDPVDQIAGGAAAGGGKEEPGGDTDRPAPYSCRSDPASNRGCPRISTWCRFRRYSSR